MAHKIRFNPETGIIETTLTGVIPFEEVKELIAQSTLLAKEHQCYLWLTDYSAATPHLSTTEIFELPKLFAQAAAELKITAYQIKRAIVISKDNADYPFAKIIAQNRGQSLELFDNLESARAWLQGRPF